MSNLEFKIGDWKPLIDPDWTGNGYLLVQYMDLPTLRDEILKRQNKAGGGGYSARILASYLSYIAQTLKDIDFVVQAFRKNPEGAGDIVERILNYSLDSPITTRQPWRYTTTVITYMLEQEDLGSLCKEDPYDIYFQIERLLFRALSDDQFMSLEKYVKTANVLLDFAFEAGWYLKFNRCLDIKKIEGMTEQVSKGLEIREVSLVMANSFFKRGMPLAVKKILKLGFMDIREVIEDLTHEETKAILLAPPKYAVKVLMNAGEERSLAGTHNNIAAAVMRILSTAV